jgi:hypothetical protein
VDAGLLELPRRHRVKSADIGIPENSYAAVSALYASGSPEHQKVGDQFREAFLEMMSKTPYPGVRYVTDPRGRRMFGKNGGALAKHCSEWAVDQEDCRAASSTGDDGPAPIVQPGHWKTFVEKNWKQIMPRLIFSSEIANPGANTGAKDYDAKTWEATWAAATSDTNAERAATLKWLVPFIKNGSKTTWDGRK